MRLEGLLLREPDAIPPSGNFTTPTQLVTVFVEEADEVFKLTATEEAAAVLASAQKTPCPVVLEVRPRSISLAELTNGARKGRAYKLRIVGAQLPDQAKGGRQDAAGS